MKNNKPRERKSVEKFIFLNYIVIFIVLVVLMFTLFFIYKNIYQTIDTTKNHVLVKINPSFEPIDFDLYNKTLENWQKKINKDRVWIERDPFYQVDVTSTEYLEISTTTEDILSAEELEEEVEIIDFNENDNVEISL